MTVDVAVLVGTVGGFLGVVGVIAASIVVVRSKIASVTIELLNQNLDAQEKRIDLLTQENATLLKRVVLLEHTKDELFREVKSMPAFADLATGLSNMAEGLRRQTELLQSLFNDVKGLSWQPGDPDRRQW